MPDKLTALRRAATQMRDLADEILDLEEQLAEKKKEMEELKHQKLPDMFMEAGVDSLSLAADDENDACNFKLKPYYRACIAASWPAEKRAAAFAHLEKLGFGDVIKRSYRIDLPKGETKLAQRLEAGLNKIGLTYAASMDVPHQTLTALLREQFESGNKKLDLDKIGGQAGMIVTLK